jgi:hypothetical protein
MNLSANASGTLTLSWVEHQLLQLMLLTVLLHLVPVSASITYCTIVTIQKIIPLSYITCQPVMLSEKCVLCWCQFLTVLSSSFKNFMNNEGQFKVALKRYLNMHTFWSVDEFLMLNNDLPYFILKSNKTLTLQLQQKQKINLKEPKKPKIIPSFTVA